MSRTFVIHRKPFPTHPPASTVQPLSTLRAPVLAFCGVATTGKTTLADALKDKYGDAIAVAPSFSRKAYKLMGIADEAEMHKLSKDRLADVQVALFEHYCTMARHFVMEAQREPSVRAVILQRTPFDHLAYIKVHVGIEHTNAAQLRRQALAFLKSVKLSVVAFPYPAPWSLTKSSEDGFRQVDHLTYEMLNIEQAALLKEYASSISALEHLTKFDLPGRVSIVASLLKRLTAKPVPTTPTKAPAA